jgi:hypothetical protein
MISTCLREQSAFDSRSSLTKCAHRKHAGFHAASAPEIGVVRLG